MLTSYSSNDLKNWRDMLCKNIVQSVKVRLELDSDEVDALLESYVYELITRVQHYLNVPRVPIELIHTLVSMTVDLLKSDQKNHSLLQLSKTDDAEVKTVRLGDAQVELGEHFYLRNDKNYQNIIKAYKADLHYHRKMRW